MNNDFGEIFDSLNKTYSDLEVIWGQLYDDVQKNTDEEKLEMFYKVTNVASGVLVSQMQFVDSYADSDMKDYCKNSILRKEKLIKKTIEEINESNRNKL